VTIVNQRLTCCGERLREAMVVNGIQRQ